MKKVLLISLVLIVAISYFNGQAEEILIPENAIRFRVIANSNTYEDQALKMKVRDALQADLYFLLKDTKTEEEASQLIESSIPAFSKTIEQVLQGSNQTFQINYGMNYFPEKVYKGVKYADGDYQSLVVTLGEGKGDNWWCVLFPPLCLLEAEETEETTEVEYQFFVKELIDQFFGND